MTRMTVPDCAVIMCNLINTHTHTHTHTVESLYPWSRLIIGFHNKYHWFPLGEDQCEWHIITRMAAGLRVYYVQFNKQRIHTHYIGYVQFNKHINTHNKHTRLACGMSRANCSEEDRYAGIYACIMSFSFKQKKN